MFLYIILVKFSLLRTNKELLGQPCEHFPPLQTVRKKCEKRQLRGRGLNHIILISIKCFITSKLHNTLYLFANTGD